MAEEAKAILRVAGLLAIGLVPALVELVIAPSRGIAVASVGSAAMAIAFVLWTQRLVVDLNQNRLRQSTLREDLSSVQETVHSQARELRDAKTHDAATGALNRSAFLRRLEETIARDGRLGKSLAFLLVDVEGFKAINLERGRIGGDAILQRVAHALADATRGTDWVGRLGGDEFGVVLNECEDPGPAVNRIFSNLRPEAGVDGDSAVHVSVGAVTIENPAGGVELSELFRLAEGALSSVRGTGGNLCARRTLRGATHRQTASA
jgi:diguanylate cyclase (GGDEF)-like protein